MKLGELRKLTKNLSDDVEVIITSSNYELKGSMVELRWAKVVKVKKEKLRFIDDFDGIDYSKEVYISDENGKEVLYLNTI